MLFSLYTGSTGRPRDISTRIYRGITPRYPDSIERSTPEVLPDFFRIITLIFSTRRRFGGKIKDYRKFVGISRFRQDIKNRNYN